VDGWTSRRGLHQGHPRLVPSRVAPASTKGKGLLQGLVISPRGLDGGTGPRARSSRSSTDLPAVAPGQKPTAGLGQSGAGRRSRPPTSNCRLSRPKSTCFEASPSRSRPVDNRSNLGRRRRRHFLFFFRGSGEHVVKGIRIFPSTRSSSSARPPTARLSFQLRIDSR